MSSAEEIYRSSYEELQKTMENQRKAYARINQLAVDLAKIDLLTVSAILAGVSFSGLSLSLPFVAGLLTFAYAMWCCVHVYEPRLFPAGIGTGVVEEIDETVQNGKTVEEHYRQLMFTYSEAISHLDTVYSSVICTFRNALWASVTAIVLFMFVAVRRLLPSYPFALDLAALVTVSAVVLRTKNKYERR